MTFPTTRMRRRRVNPVLRAMIRETTLSIHDLVQPLFVKSGLTKKQLIASLPGQYQWSLNDIPELAQSMTSLGIPAVILFGIPAYKDEEGSSAWQDDNVVQEAIRLFKQLAPDVLVIADVCCCEYTDHGHCGPLTDSNDVDNDRTLPLLAKQAVSFAKAGADIVAPSGMMDGMVNAIRVALDESGYSSCSVLSYSTKYASALYSAFREAAESGCQFGDRRTYQMDPANAREALLETQLDLQEGADMLMVKPAGMYLDIIRQTKEAFPEYPLSAYQVSSEYAMIKAAAQNGWINEKDIVLESLVAIKRAGADFILTYYAMDVANWLKNNL